MISAEVNKAIACRGFFIPPSTYRPFCQPHIFGAKVPVITFARRESPTCRFLASATESNVMAGLFSFPAEGILVMFGKKPAIDSKECPGCHRVLPRSDFHKSNSKSDGMVTYCKDCLKSRMQAYYQENKEEILRKTKEYQATPQAIEYRKKAEKKYRNSEQGRQVRNEQHRRYRENHKDRHNARSAVSNAVIAGRLPKVTTLTCDYQFDGCTIQATEYHHYAGYDKENWLTVKPVCLNCHIIIEERPTR